MKGISGSVNKGISMGKSAVSKNIGVIDTGALVSEAKKVISGKVEDVVGKLGDIPGIDTSAATKAIDSMLDKGGDAVQEKINEVLGTVTGGGGESGS